MRPSKRGELIEKALDVFEDGGFHATGVDGLAAAVGMSKTSIYNHFASKDALILAALDHRSAAFAAALDARIEAAPVEPVDRLLALFDALGDWFESPTFRGCAFIRAAAEHPRDGDPIRARAKAEKQATGARVGALVDALDLPDGAASATLRDQILILTEGAVIRAQMGLDARPDRKARIAAETLIAAAIKSSSE
ncbi:MAG: TetR/AcrR family transcriptional regulator [Pseudomonadota bacterium]